MPSSALRGRTLAVATGASLLLALGGVGGAVASHKVGGQDIQDRSIGSVDLKKKAVTTKKIKSNTVRRNPVRNGTLASVALPGTRLAWSDSVAGQVGATGATG